MKKLSTFLLLLTFVLTANQIVVCQKSESPFAKLASIQDKFEPLRFSEIKPAGWLKQQMQRDLKGFVGNLDSIVPDLIAKDDIYGKDRLTKKVKSKNVGAISDGGDWEVQFLWWNSETQSNWRDGLFGMRF